MIFQWRIDHAGPLVKSHNYIQILVIVDAFSKYCSLRPIPKKTSADSICALQCVFDKLGAPKRIIADRGAAFTSRMFKTFLAEQKVELHHIATGTPRGNGQVERLRRTIFKLDL
jgi:transposase InsO family protein